MEDQEKDLGWVFASKEMLGPNELLKGLLDFGLFSERLPPCFATEGLTEITKNWLQSFFQEKNEKKLKQNLDRCSHDFIRYEALRDTNVSRQFGVPHPEAYALLCFGLHQHWQEISEHCNTPDPTFSRIHVRQLSNGRVFEMNYKGAQRYGLEEQEIQWKAGARFLVKADIASCFHSIYSHSIPWALHGKTEAKNSTSLIQPGNLLDKVTQLTRDKQTNGLLIGPHASNVISEIVLTAVDFDLQQKFYKKVIRHIDDYTFYASTHEEAEKFVKDLSMSLRNFELSLNDKKTQIIALPQPSQENWVQALNRFSFPSADAAEIRFSTISSFLDLALEQTQKISKSTPLNYAIKTISGHTEAARNLNDRAKRLYALEAMNLALAYPYLVPVLDKFVFDRYPHSALKDNLKSFLENLLITAVDKHNADSFSYAIYYALKHQIHLDVDEGQLRGAVELDDCIANVLLLEYTSTHRLKTVYSAIKQKTDALKSSDKRKKDKNWLLIYQLWSADELNGNAQCFLGKLKSNNFKFLKF